MIKWSSIDVIDPIMDETIIVKKKGTVTLIELDSRHGMDHHIDWLLSTGYTLWSDTNG